MSDLILEITRVEVRRKDCYYILIQLDEEDSGYKTIIRKIKNRTEISEKLDFPVFEKNTFLFENLNFNLFPNEEEEDYSKNKLNQRPVNTNFFIRFGLFKTKENNEDNKKISENSTLIGNANFKIEKDLIEKLKKGSKAEFSVNVLSIEHYDFEVAKIFFSLKIKIRNKLLGDKISAESISIYLYDPLEKNKDVISKKLNNIIQLNLKSQAELDKLNSKLTESNKNLALVELDFLKVSEEKEKLKFTLNHYKKELSKLQNYKELPIEIEMLMQSEQGVLIVKKKFAILANQIQSEKNRRKVFENEFKEMIPDIFKSNFSKNKIEFLQRAYNELNFHIKRYKDMAPLVDSYDQRFQNNKSIIENLEKNISFYYKAKKGEHAADMNSQIKKLSLEKSVLLEKKKQLAIYDGLFNKEISDFEKRQYFENKMRASRNKKEDFELEIKTNIYNFSTAQNDFERKMFEEMKRKEKQENLQKIISNDPIMTQLLRETEAACEEIYSNRIKDLNNQAYQLYEKLKNKNKREIDFSIIEEDCSVFGNTKEKDNESVLDENKEFLINEIDVLQNKEKILLDELNFSYNYFEEQVKTLKNRLAELDNLIENN